MTKEHKVVHQFSLFGFQPQKIRMPKEEKQKLAKLLRESKALFYSGKQSESVIRLRQFRERLEDFERRITNGKP